LKEVRENFFKGKVVVFTGELKSFTRSEASELVESLGGQVVDSVSKKVNLVVVGENPGSKYNKALSLGIPIIRESEFLEKLKEAGIEVKGKVSREPTLF
ncbi:MAG: hypothetical protein H5T71_04920, partial [Chloroflexi bacterium]|nr:hypothetical protein [Chloroflexota bacterium]